MKRSPLTFCALFSGAASAVVIAACTTTTAGTGPTGGGNDSGSDVQALDAVNDTTVPLEAGDAGGEAGDATDGRASHDAGEAGQDEAGRDARVDSPEASAEAETDAPPEAATDAEADVAADGPDEAGDAACPGVICNGQCTSESDCHACSGAPLLCAPTGTCTSSCQRCTDPGEGGLPIECFACDSNHQNPIGKCAPNNSNAYCLSGNYLGQYDGGSGYRCGCTSVSDCPGVTQVCVPLGATGQKFCLTCGETTLATIQGESCQGGGSCQAATAVCQ